MESNACLPSDWKTKMHQSNFVMARQEIAKCFRLINQRAASEGKQAIIENEIDDAWQRFAENPCYETAIHFVSICPNMFEYFMGCCPGGLLWESHKYLQH